MGESEPAPVGVPTTVALPLGVGAMVGDKDALPQPEVVTVGEALPEGVPPALGVADAEGVCDSPDDSDGVPGEETVGEGEALSPAGSEGDTETLEVGVAHAVGVDAPRVALYWALPEVEGVPAGGEVLGGALGGALALPVGGVDAVRVGALEALGEPVDEAEGVADAGGDPLGEARGEALCVEDAETQREGAGARVSVRGAEGDAVGAPGEKLPRADAEGVAVAQALGDALRVPSGERLSEGEPDAEAEARGEGEGDAQARGEGLPRCDTETEAQKEPLPEGAGERDSEGEPEGEGGTLRDADSRAVSEGELLPELLRLATSVRGGEVLGVPEAQPEPVALPL